ncbi:HU family DNA-binding protein [uncultured Bacteroides sp.]|uniref:HU family DNA-binding protein n=1 Tax=uncultured Bacteroides sp. TaxID=162156 RepID=UPI0025E97F2C|nr:HU family DNA-binding protein [uncultured Bacteroides sp.]
MPVLYKAIQSILETKEKKKLFYPRVIYTGNVSTARIAQEIAAYSSLSPGDVKNTLDNLMTVMSQHLQASESVTLDGLGTFRLVMKAGGNGAELPEKVSAAQASLTVRFQPAYTKNPDRTTATRSLVTGAKCVRFDLADAPASGGNSGNPGGGSDGDDGETPDPGV